MGCGAFLFAMYVHYLPGFRATDLGKKGYASNDVIFDLTPSVNCALANQVLDQVVADSFPVQR